MILTIHRYENGTGVLGLLFINDEFQCYTLEPENCIPKGVYPVTFRTWGGFHSRYKKRFPEFHKGTLWIRDVPGRKYILIHIGNLIEDTEGCILVGDSVYSDNISYLSNSTQAYKKLYQKVIQAKDKIYLHVT